jgi:hypothetical protein
VEENRGLCFNREEAKEDQKAKHLEEFKNH